MLCPLKSGKSFLPGSGHAVLYIRRAVGRSEHPGLRTIRLTVRAGGRKLETAFSMRISKVRLPRTGKDSVIITNWPDPQNFGFPDRIRLWSPRFRRLAAEHAAQMYSIART